MSVILFHVGTPVVSGGYAGVDVFFVISGYLITGGIWREVQEGKFSILGFYERRVRRIYPALLALLGSVLAIGTVVLMPDELRGLGAETAAAVAFSSNILFWIQTDYFATAAELKPLLHTWSLSVEEQFYLVIAPLMAVTFGVFGSRVKPILGALCLVSFIASCIAAELDPAGNYYLPWNRAWELMLGSLVALYSTPRFRKRGSAEILSLVSVGLLLLPMIMLDRDSTFPAWNALPTCVGTAALIAIGHRNQTGAAKILSLPPLRWIGLISYSLYLVHWPILVFFRYLHLREPSGPETLILLIFMIAVAWLSWRYIELPFRARRTAQRRLFFEAAFASAALGVLGVLIFALNGIPQRLGRGASVAQRDNAQAITTRGCFLKGDWRQWRNEECFLTKGPGPVVLLWGDSHANHYAPVLRKRAAAYQSRVLLFASAGCPPVIGLVVRGRPHCVGNNAYAMDLISRYGVSKVVLSAAWEYDFGHAKNGFDRLRATVAVLRSRGVEVAVIGDNPAFPFNNPQYLGVRLARRANPAEPFYTAVKNDFGTNARIAQAVAPSSFFDPMPLLCRTDTCLAFHNGRLLMRDGSHFSTYGAELVFSRFEGAFRLQK